MGNNLAGLGFLVGGNHDLHPHTPVAVFLRFDSPVDTRLHQRIAHGLGLRDIGRCQNASPWESVAQFIADCRLRSADFLEPHNAYYQSANCLFT